MSKKNKVDIMAILETRVRKDKEKAMRLRRRGWEFSGNGNTASNGRIWILWKPQIRLVVLEEHPQFIHTNIETKTHGLICCTFIYASNSMSERNELWQHMRRVGQSIQGLWVVMGDFNAVRRPKEVQMQEGEVMRDRSMEEFETCL